MQNQERIPTLCDLTDKLNELHQAITADESFGNYALTDERKVELLHAANLILATLDKVGG